MKKNRKYQKGQAITETVIALIGMMAVFLGLLFISALGIENIKCLIMARSEADQNAANGTVSDGGQTIIEWNLGDDGQLFTCDDTPVTTGITMDNAFGSELEDTSEIFDLRDDFDSSYVVNNFADNLPVSNFFVEAANMTSSTQISADPIGERGLGDLKEAFNALIVDSDFSVEQKVYMPMVPE